MAAFSRLFNEFTDMGLLFKVFQKARKQSTNINFSVCFEEIMDITLLFVCVRKCQSSWVCSVKLFPHSSVKCPVSVMDKGLLEGTVSTIISYGEEEVTGGCGYGLDKGNSLVTQAHILACSGEKVGKGPGNTHIERK